MRKFTVWAPDVWDPLVEQVLVESVPPRLELAFTGRGPDRAAEADFLLAGPKHVTGDAVRASERLRLVQKWGVGVDSIDLQTCEELGIGVAITAGANAHAVAEHAVMMMLAVLRQVPYADRRLRDGSWVFAEMRARCRQLSGRTVGIVGLGNIGQAVARRLTGFDTDVLYYDPVRPGAELELQLGVSYVPMNELLARSDVLTLHCPGGSNHHLISAAQLAELKPGAILINTARGDLVDTDALVTALARRSLAGAGLDVYEQEPLGSPHPLLGWENVVLTPHTAASVPDNVPRVARHAFGNMLRLLDGEPLAAADLVVTPRRTTDPGTAS